MEGVTNFPMRLWFWLTSAPQTMGTPFLRATPTFPTIEVPETFAPELFGLRDITPYTLIPQIMTADARDFIRTAKLFAAAYRHIELNAGCPSPNCIGKGAGSSLLFNPGYFANMIQEISATLGPEKFAVKMRTGFHSNDEFPQLITALQGAKICRLTIHGRNRPQGYKGYANWELIEHAAKELNMPVFASGDITDSKTLRTNRTRFPNISGVIIGRGALRNPWVFSEIRTGEPQSICKEVVVYALAAFGLMQELFQSRCTVLIELTAAGLFKNPCLLSPDAWKYLYHALSVAVFGTIVEPGSSDFEGKFVLDRKTAGRMKLLWNYLRSSLPASFFVPQVLRSPGPGALLNAIGKLFSDNETVALKYSPDLDWIFNGEKNERQAAIQQQALQKNRELTDGSC